jgi:hypothetical protein
MLRACSGALPQGRCEAEDYIVTEGETVAAVAVIQVDKDGNAWIEVGTKAEKPAKWERQDLRFSQGDPPIERFRSIGFMVASMVDDVPVFFPKDSNAPVDEKDSGTDSRKESEASVSEDDESQTRGSKTSAAKKSEPEVDPRHSSSSDGSGGGVAHLSVLGQVSAARKNESLRGGVLVRAGAQLFVPHLEVLASGGWSAQPENEAGVSISFLTVDVGLGVPIVWKSANLLLRGTGRLLLENVRARATDKDLETSHRLHRWMLGSAWGGEIAYPADGPWRGTIGGELLLFEGGTGIELNGTAVGSVPARNFRGFAGFSYYL